jgi:hypothetical protein
MTAPGDAPTAQKLIETLIETGDFEAASEALDALRLRVTHNASLLPLQARLYLCEPVSIEKRRAALAPWCNGALDQLARSGALLECVAGFRVMTEIFPEETMWHGRLARIEFVLTPLPNPNHDSVRSQIDALIARGATDQAWTALSMLARQEPRDQDLRTRLQVFREIFSEPLDTRSYGALSPEQSANALAAPVDVAAVALRIQRAVQHGDLRSALADATALSQHAGSNPRWQRFRSALQRLVAWSLEESVRNTDEEPTQRTGAMERADQWFRAGNLRQAREAIRSHLTRPLQSTLEATLTERLSDLDIVLDGTLPTPLPARPVAAVTGVAISAAISDKPDSEVTERSRDALPNPTAITVTENTASQPPVTSDVKVGKRKIVRLS